MQTVQTVPGKMLDEDRYISVAEFDRVTADQFKSKIEELQARHEAPDHRSAEQPGGEVTTGCLNGGLLTLGWRTDPTVANEEGTRGVPRR